VKETGRHRSVDPLPGEGQQAVRTLPVTQSVLSAGSLLSELVTQYGVRPPARCRLLRPGINDTYQLQSGTELYVVAVYGHAWRTPDAIGYELDLRRHLWSMGVPVSVAVRGLDGCEVRWVTAPEGRRALVVFTMVDGHSLSWDNLEHCSLIGRLAGMIHAHSAEGLGEHRPVCLDLGHLIDEPLAALAPVLAQAPDDEAYLQALASRLREWVSAAATSGLDWGPCHGDISVRNVTSGDDDALVVSGFELCGEGWRAFDLAAVEWAATAHRSPAIWDAFLTGYTEVRALEPSELEVIPLFHVIRQLWRLGLRARHAAVWGYASLQADYIASKLGFFRKWERDLGRASCRRLGSGS
jgi:Ser/Thr protein kinase RdoA (MazF antagonist)